MRRRLIFRTLGMDPDQRYLTPRAVSQRLGGAISIKTLRNWRSMGKGPRWVRIANRPVYPLEDLERWEREQQEREERSS